MARSENLHIYIYFRSSLFRRANTNVIATAILPSILLKLNHDNMYFTFLRGAPNEIERVMIRNCSMVYPRKHGLGANDQRVVHDVTIITITKPLFAAVDIKL